MEELQILNSEKGLNLVDNDMELYKILIDTFINESRFSIDELKEFVGKGEMKEAASYVHAAKGAGRQLGAERLASVGQKLEDTLRGKADGNIDELCADVAREYEEALNAAKVFSASCSIS